MAVTAQVMDSYTKGLREAFKQRLAISGISLESWSEEHELDLEKFITDSSIRLLVVYHESFSGLHVDLAMPARVVEQMCYFMRAQDIIITEETFRSSLQFGYVRRGSTAGLLRLMSGIHTPQVTLGNTWPETIKNQYSAELHRYLTKLT
ncbi:hypothetical protein DNTS_032179, partial [Danionella cerebrum]